MNDNISYKNSILKLKGSQYFNEENPSNSRFDDIQRSELEKVVFAKNPLTGFPDSDVAIMSDSRVSPTLRQAIQNMNHVIQPNAPSSFDDDVLLDSVQQPFESNESYYDRLQQERNDYINSSKKTEE